ncbi:Soluble secreted antigen MPT53 [Mycobacterium persicum]|uniref:Soluble secreted antigen MPT53 n=2 Tax=Mycobacterium persicum TaxID=1487726 RepID=A0ABY6RRF2_9MYCO|nr:Soluble secreted antigen MPT53 [Mycobacterium persicum]VBA30669.1 Soluble secreted antigen MPT53 [Mycobacterium persicum]
MDVTSRRLSIGATIPVRHLNMTTGQTSRGPFRRPTDAGIGDGTTHLALLAPLVALAALIALIAGCARGATTLPAAAPAVASVATSGSAGAHLPVPAQLQFTAKTLDGRIFSGEGLSGKPAVLWFWAPWCPVCQREAATVGKVGAAYPTVTFVGVAAQDQVPAMRDFVDRYQLTSMPQLADTDAAVWAKFGVTAQPAFAFVSANGTIDVVEGPLTEPELTKRVSMLADL